MDRTPRYRTRQFWIRWNLVVIPTLVLGFGSLALSQYHQEQKAAWSAFSLDLNNTTRSLAKSVSRPLYNMDDSTLRQILIASFDEPELDTVFLEEETLGQGWGFQRKKGGQVNIRTFSLETAPANTRTSQQRIRVEGLLLGQLVVAFSTDALEERLATHRQRSYWTFGLLTALLLGLSNIGAWLYLFLRSEVEIERSKLRENEARYRIVASQPGQFVYDCRLSDNSIQWSGDLMGVTGYPASHFANVDLRQWESAIHPEDRETTLSLLERVVKTREPYRCTYRFRHRDGHYIHVEDLGLFTQETVDGETHMLGIMRDISSAETSKHEIQQLRALLANIINSMPSVLACVDTTGRVIHWNTQAMKATGLESPQAEGQQLQQLFPNLAHSLKKIEEVIEKRQTATIRSIPVQQGGAVQFTDLTIYPLVSNGISGAVVRMDDVSERVKLEEMMAQSEKMMSIAGLAAGMAHEINNPLAGILQTAQVISNRLSPSMEKNRSIADDCSLDFEALDRYLDQRGLRSMLDSILSSAQRAARIIDNMLSFSRKQGARFSPHRLSALLDTTLELAANDYDLKKQYDFRKIAIHKMLPSKEPEVHCEAGQIQQVLLNLLKNAAQALHIGNIDAPEITLRLRPFEKGVELSVTDNGPGMEESVRRRIFEPFFTTKGKGVGSGLGLSVSYYLITESHKGQLDVESRPGKGCTFRLWLPLEQGQEEAVTC